MQCYTWEDNDLQNSWQYPIYLLRLYIFGSLNAFIVTSEVSGDTDGLW